MSLDRLKRLLADVMLYTAGVIGGGEIGKLTMDFYNTLTGIQWGRIPDTHGWVKEVCKY